MNTALDAASVPKGQLRTPAEVRAHLSRHGITIVQWAAWNCLPTSTVYNLLHGRLIGKRGKAHQAAVLLGLKDGEIN